MQLEIISLQNWGNNSSGSINEKFFYKISSKNKSAQIIADLFLYFDIFCNFRDRNCYITFFYDNLGNIFIFYINLDTLPYSRWVNIYYNYEAPYDCCLNFKNFINLKLKIVLEKKIRKKIKLNLVKFKFKFFKFIFFEFINLNLFKFLICNL